MAQPATKRLTFEEFQEKDLGGRYELVDGQLEELVPPRPFHSWTGGRVCSELDRYLAANEPAALTHPFCFSTDGAAARLP